VISKYNFYAKTLK